MRTTPGSGSAWSICCSAPSAGAVATSTRLRCRSGGTAGDTESSSRRSAARRPTRRGSSTCPTARPTPRCSSACRAGCSGPTSRSSRATTTPRRGRVSSPIDPGTTTTSSRPAAERSRSSACQRRAAPPDVVERMLVGVTGGTGYVGAQSVAALLRAGHHVRLLLHPAEATRPLATYGIDAEKVDVVEGDVADPTAVAALLDGVDGLLHLAGIVTVDDRREADMWRVNVDATKQLVLAGLQHAVDPIVVASSYVALFPSPTGVIGPDTPTAAGRSAYGRTKAAADRFLRGLQAEGSPVVVVYPPGIVGPALGDRPGIAAEGWAPLLRHRTTVAVRGVMPMVDVRDVADLFAALMRPREGPRRLPIGGRILTFDEVLDTLEHVTGRAFRRVRLGGRTFRGMGRVFDAVARGLPLPPSFSYEAAWLLTKGQQVDDAAALTVLGRPWRDPRIGLVEAIRSSASRFSA